MVLNQWDKERIFFSGDDYYSAITEDIKNCKISIDIEMYIFEYDEIGKAFAESLVAAAKRGVRVRIIVDGIGSAYSISNFQKIFRESGVEFKIFHPIFDSWFIPVFRTLNRRNHRKIWIFDSSIAYAGSYNVSKLHTRLVAEPWRDSGLRVEGEDIKLLKKSFEKIWSNKKVWNKRIFDFEENISNSLVRLNDSKNKRRFYYRELLFRLREAKKHVYFASAYFAPHFRLILELCYCAKRGVDVHLVVPRKSDIFFMPWVGSTYYFALLKSGVKIHEYLPTVFHAKNYIMDDWMLIGSSNLNYRSLFHDLEVDLHVTIPENKTLFLKEIEFLIDNSETINFDSFKKISWFRQKAAQFLLLFKSWL